jgi:hypothetical protein
MAKYIFNIGDRVIRKKANSYGGACFGTITNISGDNIEINWDGKYSNLKKIVKLTDLLPIAEKDSYIKNLKEKNSKKLIKSLRIILDAYELEKDSDGWWLYENFLKCIVKNKIVGIGLSELEKYCGSEENRKNDHLIKDNVDISRGMILAVRLQALTI